TFSLLLPPPRSTLFPYTTLFRSTRTATLISADQQRALAEYLSVKIERNEWKYWVVGGVIAFYLALLSRGDWRIFAAGLVIGSLRSEEHTSELQSRSDLVCRLLLE